MKEIVSVKLENEMDLILANRRSMKLAELCGLSVTVQTALATAVSELARCAATGGRPSVLTLGMLIISSNKKQICAVVTNNVEDSQTMEAIAAAKRLVTEVQTYKAGKSFAIQLYMDVKFNGLISDEQISRFKEYFKNEPPLSPYDEIRRKNIQLLDFADKLREREDQYRQLAETLPLMMFTVNPSGDIIYTNQWLQQYFGTIGKRFLWQDHLHPEDSPGVVQGWDKMLKSRNAFHTQGRLRNRQTADYLWHLVSVVPVKNEKDSIIQWTGFFVDINAQKLVEETLKDNVELKNAQKKLVDYQERLEAKISELNISNHELEQFAYIASHDLQEPLRKIITFSNLLTETLKDIDETSKSYFAKIISSSKRMTALIRDVLDWSRIAKTTESFVPVDLDLIVKGVITDLEFSIVQKQAVVEFKGLPVVKGIPSQMTQLFSNLISNSLKFCKVAPVIKVSARELTRHLNGTTNGLYKNLKYVEIEVADNGIGFHGEHADQIFKIFQRLNGSSEYPGTGIGLAICRKIVENHGGVIEATGEPGDGAQFKIILPLQAGTK